MSLFPKFPKYNGLTLAFALANIATEHGPKLLHMNNIDLLTRDLGNALQKQKSVLQDPAKGHIVTAYEVLPLIAEVKLLTSAVATKLGIATDGKDTINVLQEIVEKTEARDSQAADGVKDTLNWTRNFFAHPEIREVLKSDVTEIKLPASLNPKEIFNTVKDAAFRATEEISRLTDFLSKAKTVGNKLTDAKGETEPPAAPDTQKSKPQDGASPKV